MAYKAWHDGVFSSVQLDTAPCVIVARSSFQLESCTRDAGFPSDALWHCYWLAHRLRQQAVELAVSQKLLIHRPGTH